LDYLHYDLHYLHFLPFFQRLAHDEQHYERQQQHHGVAVLPHSTLLDDDGNTLHYLEHDDRLQHEDDERNGHV
jgi:hypothetical protein